MRSPPRFTSSRFFLWSLVCRVFCSKLQPSKPQSPRAFRSSRRFQKKKTPKPALKPPKKAFKPLKNRLKPVFRVHVVLFRSFKSFVGLASRLSLSYPACKLLLILRSLSFSEGMDFSSWLHCQHLRSVWSILQSLLGLHQMTPSSARCFQFQYKSIERLLAAKESVTSHLKNFSSPDDFRPHLREDDNAM